MKDKPYCPNCGLAVGPLTDKTAIDAYVQARVAQELSTRLKDQASLVREIGDKAEDVVWARLKRYGWIVTALIVILGLWGIKSIDDAGTKIVESGRQRVEPLIKSLEARVTVAQGNITKAADKTTALNTLIDSKTQAVSALESKLVTAQASLSTYDARMHNYETRVLKSGSDALAQVDTLRKGSAVALDGIAKLQETVNRQQKELTETGALVKDLASRTVVEGFRTGDKPDSFVIITHGPTQHSVYMRLSRMPYPPTIRLQWNTAVQPLDSYVTYGNVIILNWADTIDKFSQRAIYASYVADASITEQQLFKKLSVKDNRAYIDGKPLPYLAVPDSVP